MEDLEEETNGKFLTSLDIFNIVTYSFVLLFASYMIVKYLILEKKDITYLVAYYSLTVALAISKICYFIIQLTNKEGHLYMEYLNDLSSRVGPQFKVLIGLIQVAIMVELGIQVKMSARRMTQEEAEKKIKNLRCGFKLASAFFSIVGIFDVYNNFYDNTYIVPDPKQWHRILYYTIFPSELVLISISLTIAYCYLSVNIKEHFAEQLQDEGKRIRAIFVFFSLSYISRAVVYILSQVFKKKYEEAVYDVLYFFWDVLPLSLIMSFHYKCFKAQEEYDNRQSSESVEVPDP